MYRMVMFVFILFLATSACLGTPAAPAQPTPTVEVAPPTETPLPTPTETLVPTADPNFRDEFDGSLGEGWQWVNEDPGAWSLTDHTGYLRIIAKKANIADPINLLLRNAPQGNFELSTKVYFNPSSNFQFAGLVIYQDAANNMQYGRAFAQCDGPPCGGNAIYFDHNLDGKPAGGNMMTKFEQLDVAYLILRREGNTYTGFFSPNGVNWTQSGMHSSTLNPLFIGVIASQAYQAETPADFEYFDLKVLP